MSLAAKGRSKGRSASKDRSAFSESLLDRVSVQIVETARDPVLLLDEQSHVRYANPLFFEVFKTTSEETLGEEFSALGNGQWNVAPLQVLIEQIFRKGTSFDAFEVEHPFPEIGPRIMCLEGRRIAGGRVGESWIVLVIEDVTERKNAEQELMLLNKNLRDHTERLEHANEELQQFAYVASHDLQEPLRMVASYIQLLEKRYSGELDEEADRFIEYASNGARRMQNLIKDLLSYSRAGRDVDEVQLVDMNSVFDQAVHGLAKLIEESGARVTKGNLPEVMGDSTQLLQVLQNLLENSLKYRGEEVPVIHVNAEKKSNKWVISVYDNGIGFDPQHSERIFQVFQRLNRRDENAGSGIGLAVAKKIVERHGGTISAESVPGKGATFAIALPAPLLVRGRSR